MWLQPALRDVKWVEKEQFTILSECAQCICSSGSDMRVINFQQRHNFRESVLDTIVEFGYKRTLASEVVTTIREGGQFTTLSQFADCLRSSQTNIKVMIL